MRYVNGLIIFLTGIVVGVNFKNWPIHEGAFWYSIAGLVVGVIFAGSIIYLRQGGKK